MPKKRIRVGLLSGSILLLTASRPTKPETTEISVEGSMGQLEDKELAGSHTYPATGGGCGSSGSPARTVKVYRHYSGLTLVAGSGVGRKTSEAHAMESKIDRARPAALPDKKTRWIDQPTSSPFLNY